MNYSCLNYHCGNCIYYGTHTSPCTKRIDHEKIKFATPFFKSYDRNQFSGIVCSDFVPRYNSDNFNFQDYWNDYVEVWLPYSNTNILIWFTLNEDISVRYGVKLMDYVYGTMYDSNGNLKAIKKKYYKKTKDGFGYKLITENI